MSCFGFSALWFAWFGSVPFLFFSISPSCEEGLSRGRKLTPSNLLSLQRNIKQHGFEFSNMCLWEVKYRAHKGSVTYCSLYAGRVV